MYSVDLAAVDFLSRNGVDFDLFTSHTFPRRGRYRLLPWGIDIGHQRRAKFGELTFNRLSDISQLYSYTHVFYWGDFTPNPIYGYEDFQRWERRRDVRSTKRQSLDRWARLFNLSGGAIPPLTIAVGNNFQHDYSTETDLYGKYIKNLGSNFDIILPRDSFSVDNLKNCLQIPERSKVLPGIDPAFLLKDNAIDGNELKSDVFSYRFARSQLPPSQHYVLELEKTTGYKGVHLSHWDRLDASDAHPTFMRYIADIRRSRFVVTDLYHLAINAIRLNVPVFCLGNSVDSQQGSLGDFKKKILFGMLNIGRYYIEVDLAGDENIDGVVKFIGGELGDYEENVCGLYKFKDELTREFESRLLSVLSQS